jgi:asparagine synthase (glutamine-hydrolysing)
MCGIVGMVVRRGAVKPELLQRAAALLQHRGPDGHGVYSHDSVGLAHTRLSIIDLAGGQQPIIDQGQDYVLVANGEVYNYVDLRAELEQLGCRFVTHSDSETILHAYARCGRDGFRRLRGMYAVALYSVRERTLLLARDRLGIKPLFYCPLPNAIVFASEIKALLPLLPRVPAINPRALVQCLELGFSSGPDTLFQGVMRVEPGTMISIDSDLNIRQSPYWSALEVEPRDLTFEAAQEEFDAVFDQVLHEHRRSDVPYGLFLSGGIDSGTLLALLNRHQNSPLRTFSVGYTDTAADELPVARRMADLFGSEHTEFRLSRQALFRALPLSVWAADELLDDLACLPTALMAQGIARELKVVFTGEGGDEVFAGYGRYRRTGLQRFLKTLWVPGSEGYRTRSQWPRPYRQVAFGQLLRRAHGSWRDPIVQAWQSAPKTWSALSKAQLTDLQTELRDSLLVKVDRMLMAFGLEGRVPYLDHRVVEFGLALPPHLKVQGHSGKLFLRRWAQRYVPRDHLDRKKRGFHVPLDSFLQDGCLLDQLAGKLAVNPMIREWFQPEAVPSLVALYRKGHKVYRELLQLLKIAVWHRLFVDPAGSQPSAEENPLDWIA